MKTHRTLSTLLAAALLIGCGDETTTEMRRVCTCEQRERVEGFMRATIADANNKSDEEMEDVVAELYRVAIELHCDPRAVRVTYNTAGFGERTTIKSMSMKRGEIDSCMKVTSRRMW